MPTTILTGSTGFVGSSILHQLLTSSPPHHVILPVRKASASQSLFSTHPEYDKSLLTFATVPDITVEGAFDSIFRDHAGIDYVIHCAAPLVGDASATDFVEHFEKPNVLGNLRLLSAAKTLGQNVKTVVVTGTINAVTMGSQDDVKARAFTSESWLPEGHDDAIKTNQQFVHYCVGKKVGEEAIWKFVKEEKPKFGVVVFLPGLIFGPMQQSVKGIDRINFSMQQVHSILNSGKSDGGKVPGTMFPAYVDLRDLSDLHIAALTTPAAAGKRFLVAHPFTFDDFGDALRNDGDFEARVGKPSGEEITLPRIDEKPVEEVFDIKFRTAEETARDCARDLLRIEKLSA